MLKVLCIVNDQQMLVVLFFEKTGLGFQKVSFGYPKAMLVQRMLKE